MSTVFYGYQLAPGRSAQLVLPMVRAAAIDRLLGPDARFADGDPKPVAPVLVRVFQHAHYGEYVEPRPKYPWMVDGLFDVPALRPVFVDTRSEPASDRAMIVVDAVNAMIVARQFFLYELVGDDDLNRRAVERIAADTVRSMFR